MTEEAPEANRLTAALVRRIFDPIYLKDLLRLPFAKTADELALRKDMLAMMTYLKENKVKGTPSTGNFTLKAVEGIAARFVNPLQMIDDNGFRVRSEAEIWPVYFLHALGHYGRLMIGGANQRWVLTSEGEQFLLLPPIPQVWTLFAIWWYAMDWEAGSPYSILPEAFPQDINQMVGELLLKQTSGAPSSFDAFVDALFLQIFGLPEAHPLPEYFRPNFSSSLEHIVIDPLERFGVITTQREIDTQYASEIKHLKAITLTDFGRIMLGTAKAIGYA